MPPGIFVALAFCLAALQFKKHRKQSLLWAGFALLLWAGSLGPVGNRALAGLEYVYLPPEDLKADAVIVLSAGIKETAPETFGSAALSNLSLERAVEAARIYRRYKLPLLITGGAVFSRGTEADAIKKQLVSLGVPAANIFTEGRSRDTRENALFSKPICDEKGFKRIALVTSAYHMRRAVWTFEKAGFKEVVPWPVGYSSSIRTRSYWMDYLPGSSDTLRKAIQERLGLLFYRLSM